MREAMASAIRSARALVRRATGTTAIATDYYLRRVRMPGNRAIGSHAQRGGKQDKVNRALMHVSQLDVTRIRACVTCVQIPMSR